MAISLKHTTQAVGTDAGNGEIGKTQWNEEHTLSLATGKLVGRSTAGAGAAEEISVGTGLSLSGGTLSSTVTATPGGSDTQLQYNNAGAFAGTSGITTTGTELTIASGTKTTSTPILDMAQTWNAGAVTFTGLKLNVTDTASASASALLDLQTASTSRFTVGKTGSLTISSSGTGAVLALSVQSDPGATGSGNFNSVVLNNQNATNRKSTVSFRRSNTEYWAIGNDIAGNGGQNFYIYNTGGSVTGLYVDGSYVSAAGNGFALSASTAGVPGNDVYLTRRAAANLRLGSYDAAAPVAQTLSVQSVVAGTTNTAGANLTITGSQGTGTGAGGSIIFQVAPAGSSGTAQNALATALTINSSKNLIVEGAGTSSTGGTGVAAIGIGGNNNAGFIHTGGGLGVMFSGNTVAAFRNTEVRVSSTLPFGFASGADPTANALDVILARDAANTLAQRNGTNAQSLRVYKTYDGTNNAYLQIDAGKVDTNNFAIWGVKSGTANYLAVDIGYSNTKLIRQDGTNATIYGQGLLWGTDNSYDIGASATGRPRSIYAATTVDAPTVRTSTAYTVATLPAAGTAGRRAYVTDATAPTYLGALTGGGTVVCPVFDNGTAWVAA